MPTPATTTEDPTIDRTLAVLGGPSVLRKPIHNRLEAHDVLQEGLPTSVLKHLVNEVAMLGGARGELEKAIGISLRTFQRRRDAAKPLSSEQSNRAWRFAEILGRATEIFGSRAEAEAWLQRPAMALDQRRPIDLLTTQAGVEAVGDHLTRMEYGAYT